MKKTTAILLALILGATMLAGCAFDSNLLKWPDASTDTETKTETPATAPTPTETETETETNTDTATPTETETTPETPSGPKKIVFENGMVVMTIEDGKGIINLDLGLWEKSYGLYEDNLFYTIESGPFTASNPKGAIADACIAYIEALDRHSASASTVSAVLLMQDGSICMTHISPFVYDGDMELYCYRLPWLKDIATLTAADDKNGDATVYATDAEGLRYDVRIPAGFSYIINSESDWKNSDWYTLSESSLKNILYFSTTGWDTYRMLALSDNGSVAYELHDHNGQLYEEYGGKYEVQLAENPGPGKPPAGTITFSLGLGWWIDEYIPGEVTEEELAFAESRQSLEGSYAAQINIDEAFYGWREDPVLTLTHTGGKGLILYFDGSPTDAVLNVYKYNYYEEHGFPRDESEEFYWYCGDKSNEAGISLAQYLLDSVYEVENEVLYHGLYLNVDGTEVTFSSGKTGKNVYLVNYLPGIEYDVVATYTVIEGGTIYKHNRADDMWYIVEVKYG